MSRAKRFQKMATRLLTKYDEREDDDVIKLKRTGASVWNPVTAVMDPGPVTEIPVVGVITNFDKSLIDGTTIMHNDLLLKITAGQEPLSKDKVLVDGDEYSIVDLPKIRYTNLDICYFAQLRK